MKSVFLLGDFKSDNGPGMANKKLLEALQSNKHIRIEYSEAQSKFKRIVEMYIKICKNDCLLICSASNLNYQAIWWTKLWRKKVFYLMHGLESYETNIENETPKAGTLKYEKFIFSHANKIICVSEFAKKTIADLVEEKYKSKFTYIYNIVPCKENKKLNKQKHEFYTVLLVGGGTERKHCKPVTDAVQMLKNSGVIIQFKVVGKLGKNGEEIKKNECVEWIESLSHDKLLKEMENADVYIQNSLYETFGLAVIEALDAGCSLLLSNKMGCVELFENLNPNDVIYNSDDVNEIKEKLQAVLLKENNTRLRKAFRYDLISSENVSERLIQILETAS